MTQKLTEQYNENATLSIEVLFFPYICSSCPKYAKRALQNKARLPSVFVEMQRFGVKFLNILYRFAHKNIKNFLPELACCGATELRFSTLPRKQNSLLSHLHQIKNRPKAIFNLVEMGRVELPSENVRSNASTVRSQLFDLNEYH